ncbi:hypothetical protein [Neobacillus citreus]|uniref:Uncharacterized protein n=1 Tax=Neobacillus citreus TaxID=2833578 RepID=A0A942T115_9BACI|nr:hypothetical protein [Neobacillus citreus]MCH6269450.1 hypothetical protein [Neobacillus citreus]
MENKQNNNEITQPDFYHLLKKAYDIGLKEENITLTRILDELKNDLKHMLVK